MMRSLAQPACTVPKQTSASQAGYSLTML